MFGNKLNATIAKVQVFSKELEEGVIANEKEISANNKKVADMNATTEKKLKEIKVKATSDKAVVAAKSARLLDQNAIAKKLLSNLK